MNVFLWIAQVLLALFFVSASYFHGVAPHDVAVRNAPWIADVSPAFRTLIGAVELAGGIGVLIPAFARWTALGLTVLMMCATAFHLWRGEAHIIWLNLCLGAVAAFVGWGRRR